MTKVDEIMEQVAVLVFASVGTATQYSNEKAKLRAMIKDVLKTPEGYKLVPIICTTEIEAVYSNDTGAYQTAQELHSAMLSAAPKDAVSVPDLITCIKHKRYDGKSYVTIKYEVPK